MALVNSMHVAHHSEDAANTETHRDEVMERLAALEARMAELARKRGE